MNSLKRILIFRYAIAVTLIVAAVAIILAVSPHAVPAWLLLLGSLVFVIAVLAGVTLWTQQTLSSDLKEIGAALEKIVVENDLDKMPQPRLSELYGLAQDLDTIASRVKENYRLIASERDKLDAILTGIGAGIIVVGRGGKIDLINPAAERILGTTSDYALGKTFTEIHHTAAIDRAIERSRRGFNVSTEVRITLPRKRYLRVEASPITNEKGKTTGVICILEDVTAKRRLERVRKDFVTNVSHELRTPIANLRAVAEALVAGASQEPEAADRFIRDIDRESLRLSEIIEDLLILSRLESEEAAFVEESFAVCDLLTEVASEKEDLASRLDVEVSVDCRREIDFVGDRRLLKTGCANLLDNAIKYNRPGGRVDISAEQADGALKLIFADTGIGIPMRDQKRIFERFFRVDRARSRETGGTGLGLSIVKHTAELHGGTVSVRSSEGEGATFTISLPVTQTR
jgi:two-component system phosphate regulon sensor histidine kinase PhoR